MNSDPSMQLVVGLLVPWKVAVLLLLLVSRLRQDMHRRWQDFTTALGPGHSRVAGARAKTCLVGLSKDPSSGQKRIPPLFPRAKKRMSFPECSAGGRTFVRYLGTLSAT